jgi:hypothetical protein
MLKTFGLDIESTVEFLPFNRIGWDTHAIGFDGYHACLIQEISQGRMVIIEETQKEFFARKLWLQIECHVSINCSLNDFKKSP